MAHSFSKIAVYKSEDNLSIKVMETRNVNTYFRFFSSSNLLARSSKLASSSTGGPPLTVDGTFGSSGNVSYMVG